QSFILAHVIAMAEELRFCYSSRRRHTISKRHWSSDVCSSDLSSRRSLSSLRLPLSSTSHRSSSPAGTGSPDGRAWRSRPGWPRRSEERRVGKGCRPPCALGHSEVTLQVDRAERTLIWKRMRGA